MAVKVPELKLSEQWYLIDGKLSKVLAAITVPHEEQTPMGDNEPPKRVRDRAEAWQKKLPKDRCLIVVRPVAYY